MHTSVDMRTRLPTACGFVLADNMMMLNLHIKLSVISIVYIIAVEFGRTCKIMGDLSFMIITLILLIAAGLHNMAATMNGTGIGSWHGQPTVLSEADPAAWAHIPGVTTRPTFLPAHLGEYFQRLLISYLCEDYMLQRSK